MFWFTVLGCAIVLLCTIQRCWALSHDPLHPGLVLSLLFLYSYTVEPLVLGERIFDWFPDRAVLDVVGFVYLASLIGFSVGVLSVPKHLGSIVLGRRNGLAIPERHFINIAIVLAAISSAAYVAGIWNAGGFLQAYSKVKGGGRHYSGYIGESVNLGLVAAMFVGVSRWRLGFRSYHWLLVLIGISPNLLQGTFGGRRGPLFLSLGVFFLAWLVSARKQPRLSMMILGSCIICLSIVVVWSQRRHLYIGSESAGFQLDRLVSLVLSDRVDQGGNYIYGSGLIATGMNVNRFTWGREILVNVFIRPIPKQLWPRKYEDVGATWITDAAPGFGNYGPNDWRESVGWVPLTGSSSGSISDLFGEFSWLTVLVFYLIGRGLSWIYWRHRTNGGVWSVLLLEASALTIYLATQSFSAYYHRFLLLAIPTLIIWRYFFKRNVMVGIG